MLKVKGFADVVYGYEIEACGFGDAWAVTNYLLRVSEFLKKPVRFSCSNYELRNRVSLITNFLNSRGKIKFVNSPKKRVLSYCEPYKLKFFRTKKPWRHNKSKIVAFQFDGRHLATQKNLPQGRLNYLLKILRLMGYNPINVGNHKPLQHVINVLSQCQFFVGCPSGIAHVSQSVGNPIFVISWNLSYKFMNFMRGCQYKTAPYIKIVKNVMEFLKSIKETYPSICSN